MPVIKFIPFAVFLFLMGCSNLQKESQQRKIQLPDSLHNYSRGKEIFYSQCTSCHFLMNEPSEIDYPMSKKSLYEMYKEKITVTDLKAALSTGEYHSYFKKLLEPDSLNTIKTFIWDAYSPKY